MTFSRDGIFDKITLPSAGPRKFPDFFPFYLVFSTPIFSPYQATYSLCIAGYFFPFILQFLDAHYNLSYGSSIATFLAHTV